MTFAIFELSCKLIADHYNKTKQFDIAATMMIRSGDERNAVQLLLDSQKWRQAFEMASRTMSQAEFKIRCSAKVSRTTIWFLTKITILTKSLLFDQNSDFWPKFHFFTKIPIFWPTFCFLTKISIFDQNSDFWLKSCFLTKFRFVTKIPIFDKIWIFDLKSETVAIYV